MWHFNPTGDAFWQNGESLQLFFERLIMSKCYIMSVSAMSREISEPDNNLWRVIKYYVTQGLDTRKHQYLKKIAVDEKAYKKGHEYVSIFTDLDTGEEKKKYLKNLETGFYQWG